MTPTSAQLTATPTTLAKESKLKEGYVVDQSDRPTVGHNEFSDEIPVISLVGIDDGDRRPEIMGKIVAACEEWGIFQLVDHGVDDHLIELMTHLSRQFFALPDQEKLHFQAAPGKKGGFLVSSHLQGEAVANWREFVLFFTYPINDRDYSRWPNKPEEWRAVVEAYGEKVMGLALKMLELLSEGLGLDRDALGKSLGDAAQQHLVVNHYPNCPQPELAVGLKRHTDPSCITLLLQDDVGGLQATKDDGKTWFTVRPIKNALVMNLGEHMKYMSNGRFKSADHQAVVNSEETRMSIAVFTNPANEAMVYPLNLKQGDKSLLEEPITYADMNTRHKNLYLEIVRLKKLAKQENWSQELLDYNLSQLKF